MVRHVAFTTQPIPSLSSVSPLGGLTSGQQYTRDAFEAIAKRVEGTKKQKKETKMQGGESIEGYGHGTGFGGLTLRQQNDIMATIEEEQRRALAKKKKPKFESWDDIIRRAEERLKAKMVKRKRKPKKKRCRGVFLKGNPSVLALLKRIPALSVKVRDLLPSSDEGTCISRAMTVASLLRRVPGLKRKLYTLFPR